jgi:hypothetical protein
MRKQIAIAMVAIMTVSVLAMMPVMSGSGENMTNTPNVSKTKSSTHLYILSTSYSIFPVPVALVVEEL